MGAKYFIKNKLKKEKTVFAPLSKLTISTWVSR